MLRYLIFAITALFSSGVYAHSLHVLAQYDGNTVTGKAYYSDMTPAAETYVEIIKNHQDKPVIEGKTDRQGKFSFALTDGHIVKVIVEGEEGHRASTIADKITPDSNSSSGLALVREDIAQLRDKMFIRDILGGVGYILGIVGLWALWQANRLNKSSTRVNK